MKERPILFSAPMVRAILAGTKTQTRRIMKPQPSAGVRYSIAGTTTLEDGHGAPIRAVYGAPGDRLWVKETARLDAGHMGRWPAEPVSTSYVADDAPCVIDAWPWKRRVLSAIFLPRGASRLTLEVTGVRVERVQDISEADAKAEGVVPFPLDLEGDCWTDGTHRAAYNWLWNEINGWNPNSWVANPWVWVVEFKRVDQP